MPLQKVSWRDPRQRDEDTWCCRGCGRWNYWWILTCGTCLLGQRHCDYCGDNSWDDRNYGPRDDDKYESSDDDNYESWDDRSHQSWGDRNYESFVDYNYRPRDDYNYNTYESWDDYNSYMYRGDYLGCTSACYIYDRDRYCRDGGDRRGYRECDRDRRYGDYLSNQGDRAYSDSGGSDGRGYQGYRGDRGHRYNRDGDRGDRGHRADRHAQGDEVDDRFLRRDLDDIMYGVSEDDLLAQDQQREKQQERQQPDQDEQRQMQQQEHPGACASQEPPEQIADDSDVKPDMEVVSSETQNDDMEMFLQRLMKISDPKPQRHGRSRSPARVRSRALGDSPCQDHNDCEPNGHMGQDFQTTDHHQDHHQLRPPARTEHKRRGFSWAEGGCRDACVPYDLPTDCVISLPRSRRQLLASWLWVCLVEQAGERGAQC